MSFEMFKADRTVSITMRTPQGAFSGSTQSKSDFVPVPAFEWATSINENVTVGLGSLGIGGFGVDYAQDNTNPILGPRQMGGFGQVYSNFSLLKITPAISFAATGKPRLGFALNIDWALLAVDPMPVASPAWDLNPGPRRLTARSAPPAPSPART